MEKDVVSVARREELPQIMQLYRSLIGSKGCTWDLEYPSPEEIEIDIANGSLFCIRAHGAVVAAAFAGTDEDEKALRCWSKEMENPCFLARVAVDRRYQKKGLAKRLLTHIEENAGARGFDGICLLVNETNEAAASLYEACGYAVAGRAHLYGIHWVCREKCLRVSRADER